MKCFVPLSILAGMLSGPGEVDGLRLSMSFEIPSDVMVTGGIGIKFRLGKIMLLSAGSWVKTEVK